MNLTHKSASRIAPTLNIVYGDTEGYSLLALLVPANSTGNIGYWLTGSSPVRSGDTYKGDEPAKGWTGVRSSTLLEQPISPNYVQEEEWVGRIQGFEMPHLFNPKQGYITTSNNRITPRDHPLFLSSVSCNGYRGKRIVEVHLLSLSALYSILTIRNLMDG